MNLKKIFKAQLFVLAFYLFLSSCHKDNNNSSAISNVDHSVSSSSQLDSAEVLRNKDWSKPILFVGTDSEQRRISIRRWGHRLKVYVGGEMTYISAQEEKISPITTVPQQINLKKTGGRLIETAPTNTTIKFFEPTIEKSITNIVLSFKFILKDESGSLEIQGTVTERPWGEEFTVATYNVENFFDQTDDERNQRYGDYRIELNADGRNSNWGDPVQFNNKTTNFSEIKSETIKKVLISIEPTGPAVVALQEIESEQALERLFIKMQDLGYTHFKFSHWFENEAPAIGMGIISKYPIVGSKLIRAITEEQRGGKGGHFRPIFRTTVKTQTNKNLTIYNNHWPSKGKPESFRYSYGVALQKDIESLTSEDSEADYIIVGDLNCEYNEKIIIIDRHNDMDGKTGINSVLMAQGNEQLVASGNKRLKFNLQYELERSMRRTAWYGKFGWSAFDNYIIGDNLYDQIGLTYVDNSFNIANKYSYSLSFLFDNGGKPIRWIQNRQGNTYTEHIPGGYSDHLPSFARFYYAPNQTNDPISLYKPSMPNHDDMAD